MSSVQAIEQAIVKLSPVELRELRLWFAEHDNLLWDKQIENDVQSGKLDALAEEALEDLRLGRSTDL